MWGLRCGALAALSAGMRWLEEIFEALSIAKIIVCVM